MFFKTLNEMKEKLSPNNAKCIKKIHFLAQVDPPHSLFSLTNVMDQTSTTQ